MFDAGNSIMCTGGTYALAKTVSGETQKRGLGGFLKTLFSSVPFDVYILMLVLAFLNIGIPEFVVTVSSTAVSYTHLMTFVIISSGIDLSVGAIVGFSGILASMLMVGGWGIAPAVLVSVAASCGVGLSLIHI